MAKPSHFPVLHCTLPPQHARLLCWDRWLSLLLLSLMLWLSLFLQPCFTFCPQLFSPQLPSPHQQLHLTLACTITCAGLTAKCVSFSFDLVFLSLSSCFHLHFLIYIRRFWWHRKLNFSEGNIPSLLNRFSSQTEEIQFISRRSHRSGLLGSKLKGSSISHHPQLDNDLWNPAYSTLSTVTSKSVFTHYIITKLNYVMIPRPQFSKSFSLFTSYSLSEKLFFFLFMDMSYLPSILPMFVRYQVCFRHYLRWIRYNPLLKEFAIPSVP